MLNCNTLRLLLFSLMNVREMAETGQLEVGKSRRSIRDLFKRPSRANSPSPTSASQALVLHSGSQLLSPALVPQPPLGSGSPQSATLSQPLALSASTPPVSSKQPAASLNLWEEVFCKVNDETQKWIGDHELNSLAEARPEDQMKELADLVKQKEKLFKEKDSPMKIEVGSQKIIFREYVADVVGFLTMAGDVAMTFAPPQASAPWAAAKAVLKIPVKQIEQMAALAGTIQCFTRIVRRGQVYEVLYDRATVANEGAVSNLHDALIDLYVAAIELLARSDILFGGGVVKQTLSAILRPEQATGLISDLFKKEQRVSQEVQSCEALRNERAGKQTDEKIQGLLTRLDLMSLPLTRIDKGVARLLKNVDQDRLERLMDFISSEQFGKGHATIKDARIENTGDWLIDHEGFRDWQDIPSSSTLLCLKGTVGTGKTYLTSRVIDHVKETLETSLHDEGFAFFYCNRSGPLMQDPLIILRSFVRQLSYRAYNYNYVQSSLIQRCEKAKREGRDLGYMDCKELILESMNLYAKTTIILDALDESDITSYNLADILIDLMDKAIKPVKIFISSRPDREYLEAFEAKSTITVNSSNQQSDIEKYLDETLYSTKFFQKRQEEIQEIVKETFRARNGGMFRWVYLQTRSLQKCVSDDAIRSWAKTIPRDLMAAYDRLWEDLEHQHNESDMALAKRAIKWVLCSFTPLKSKTLLEAIRYICEGGAFIQKELRTEQDILSLCQDLLTIDTEREVWMLPHASVAEYFFESRGMVLGECDLFASNVLLSYLVNPDLKLPQGTYESDSLESFEGYIVCTWFKHVQRYDEWLGLTEGAASDEELVTILKCFLGSPGDSSGYYRKWIDSLKNGSLKERLTPTNMAIFIMCRYRFYYTLRDWWEHDKIDEELALAQCKSTEHWSSSRLNSLDLAVESGLVPICRHLVSVTDVNSPHARGHIQATAIAITKRDKSIITLLVEEAKADLNSVHIDSGWTPVQYTASNGDDSDMPDMLQWIVDQGWVDVNREGGQFFGNALIAATHIGYFQSVEVLLRAGADVNAAVEYGEYGNALMAAATSLRSHDYIKRTQILLDSGADVNQVSKTGLYGSALEAFVFRASQIGQLDGSPEFREVLGRLLKSGADPAMALNIGKHGSALAAAAFHGLKDFVVMMVDVTGKERAIECLRQSRHPGNKFLGGERAFEKWKKATSQTAAYLTSEVGVDKESLHGIGLDDFKVVQSERGHFIVSYG